MNVKFLKVNEHTQTEEFLDKLYTNNILPIITKPTGLTDHTAMLIDLIYTNCLQNFTAGIRTVDITDHLPVFCIVRTQPTRYNSNKKYFQDYSKVNKDLYLDDIKLIDWCEILNPEKNLNEKVQKTINTLNKIIDKDAPIKLASQKKWGKPARRNQCFALIYFIFNISLNKYRISCIEGFCKSGYLLCNETLIYYVTELLLTLLLEIKNFILFH